MPDYDLESMELVAGKIAAIHDKFQESKGKIKRLEGGHPFGAVRHPDEDPEHPDLTKPSPADETANAVNTFTDGTHTEFEAGAQLMKSTSDALTKAIQVLRAQEAAAKDSVTLKDPGSLDI
ncbi:hypothetical protein [Amycolatopsis anabasis]|uniref:hypothetical protein n=1 Tax=Amycolatopsis anabasis TaxID=1840409 RepID=UPI00131E8A1D|nr:hypothetical protein [Amycolatopsis anabasis]